MMRKLTVLVACLGLSVAVAGCGGGKRDHEAVMEDMVAAMEEFADTLGKIQSKEDVEKYKDDLEAISKKMETLQKEATALGDPPKDLDKKLKEKFSKRMAAAMGNLMGAMMGMPEDVRNEIDKMDIMKSTPAPAGGPPSPE